MAFNGLKDRSHAARLEGLVSVLEAQVGRWAIARTLEERAAVESETIATFEEILRYDLDLDAPPVIVGGRRNAVHDKPETVAVASHPEATELATHYTAHTVRYRGNLAQLKKLAELFLQYFNTQQLMLLELLGKLRRVKQKEAALSLWQEGEAKYVIAERFLNLDRIDETFSRAPLLAVQSERGVLTLPVRGRTSIVPVAARIGSGSNGVAGNSDVRVTQNNHNPNFALNADGNTWFEYERLDSGPLELSYVCDLGREEIVNEVSLTPLNLLTGSSFEVDDILFSTVANSSQSVRELVPAGLDPDFWSVRALGKDTSWSINFLPVRAKAITFKLRQATSAPLFVATTDNRQVARQRWSIGLKRVQIARVQYEKSGAINSVEEEYPAGLYAMMPFASLVPQRPEIFDAQVELSLDAGETWTAPQDLDDGLGDTVLLDGTAGSLFWRLRLSRDDEAIGNVTSFLPVDASVKEVGTLLRTFSKLESPAMVRLPEKPHQGKVFVMQPQIGRRGDRFAAVTVGRQSGGLTSFQLPFSIVDGTLDLDEVRVFVSRRPYLYQPNNTVLSPGEWSLSDDLQELEFHSSLPEGAEISMVFGQERMFFEERGDGYYHTMEMLFDGDASNIAIEGLPRQAQPGTELLARDRTLIQLDATNLVGGSFQLQSRLGVSYVEVSTRTALSETANGFLVDYALGILRLNAAFGSDTVWASYQHMSPIKLSQSQFGVFYDGLRPAGVRIDPEAFQACSMTDTVGAGPQPRLDVVTGTTTTRTDYVSAAANAMTLTHERIVRGTVQVSTTLLGTEEEPEEVPFVDGRSEFLGLVAVKSEKTNELVAATVPYVTFNLAAGALWDTTMGVSFGDTTVFAGPPLSTAAAVQAGVAGNYHVSDTGTVTLNVGLGNTLAAGIGYRYFYRNPDFDPSNKYSVDYQRGVLYSYVNLVATATVRYKAAAYRVSYDVANEVNVYEYQKQTNSVSVRTENLNDINRLVKVLWEKGGADEDLREFAAYFTPIISLLAFRFD